MQKPIHRINGKLSWLIFMSSICFVWIRHWMHTFVLTLICFPDILMEIAFIYITIKFSIINIYVVYDMCSPFFLRVLHFCLVGTIGAWIPMESLCSRLLAAKHVDIQVEYKSAIICYIYSAKREQYIKKYIYG